MAKISDLSDSQLDAQIRKYSALYKNSGNEDEKSKYRPILRKLKEEHKFRMDLEKDISGDEPKEKSIINDVKAKIKEAKAKVQPRKTTGEKPNDTTKSTAEPRSADQVPKLWNPNAAVNWSLLFTPIFGAWLHAKNWEELNEIDKSAKSKKWVYYGIAFIVLALIIPNGIATFLSIAFLLTWYFFSAKKQVNYAKERNITYQKKSWKKPLIYATGGLVGYFLVVVIIYSMFSFLGSLAGLGNADVSFVKNGTMNGYETTTVGKAFEANFDNPKWEAFESKKGERIVQLTGYISKYLHNYVADELRKQMQGNPEYMVAKIKLGYLQTAIDLVGGSDSEFFRNLDRKYNCTLELMNFTGGVHAFAPECNDDSMFEKYMDDAIEKFIDLYWKVGEPVDVQWIVSPDGESFKINYMGSSSWEGMEIEKILNVIYS